MHKTIYIDIDEEITSILTRIKKELADEIYLVIPKGAMMTQGVINLKILKKEVDQMDKKLLIVSGDAHARKVIERLGIKTSDEKELKSQLKSDNFDQEEVLAKRAAKESFSQLSLNEIKNQKKETEENKELGTDSFFDETFDDTESANSANIGLKESNSNDLKADLFGKNNQEIDNQNNSVAFFNPVKEQEGGSLQSISDQNNTPDSLTKAPNKKRVPFKSPDKALIEKAPVSQLYEANGQVQIDQKFEFKNDELDKKAEKFFLSGNSFDKKSNDFKKKQKEKTKKVFSKKDLTPQTFYSNDNGNNLQDNDYFEESSGKGFLKGKYVFIFIALAFILVGGYLWFNVSYPRVKVAIHLKNEKVEKELRVVAKNADTEVLSGEATIEGNLKEFEIEKTLKIESSGESFASDDGKAKGKVRIYNNFSTIEQPLVKTTRVLSQEGKLFRLAEATRVPGMKGDQPGMIEVPVVADRPGEDFNVGPTTFKIEGFKGNPLKYEKFEVKSDFDMSGGGEPDQEKKLTVVSSDDINIARNKTVEALEKELESKILEKIADGEKVLVDSVEKEIISSQSSHQIGQATEFFEYSVRQKIKAMVFNQQELSDLIEREVQEEAGGDYIIKDLGKVVFKKGIADFERGSLTIHIQISSVLEPKFSLDVIRDGILGKKQEGIQAFLSNYPQIEKIEITFNPSWITKVPSDQQKIEIEKID